MHTHQIVFIVRILYHQRYSAVLKFDTLDIFLFSLLFDCRAGWGLNNDDRGLVGHTCFFFNHRSIDADVIITVAGCLLRQQGSWIHNRGFPVGISLIFVQRIFHYLHPYHILLCIVFSPQSDCQADWVLNGDARGSLVILGVFQ